MILKTQKHTGSVDCVHIIFFYFLLELHIIFLFLVLQSYLYVWLDGVILYQSLVVSIETQKKLCEHGPYRWSAGGKF